MQKRIIFTTFLIMLLISCTEQKSLPEYVDMTETIKPSVLKFPFTKFDDIIWRTDGVVVAMQEELVRPLRQPYALEGDKELRYLDLEQDSHCSEITSYDYPTQLPDGRLGLVKWCVTDNAFTNESYMVAYDWSTGQLEQIVQNPLKHFYVSGCFSWNPDMTRGIQRVSEGLTGNLNWLSQIGPEPVYMTLRDGNRTWDLAKDYEQNGSIEGGRISCPSWSPTGDQIAVFVSFDAMGVEGIARLDEQSQLVLFSPGTGESESVVSGIYYPDSIEWSPDGKKIAFIGYLATDLAGKSNGIWVFDVETRVLFLVTKGGFFDDLSWSPDSKNMAVIWCDGIECETSEIRKYMILK